MHTALCIQMVKISFCGIQKYKKLYFTRCSIFSVNDIILFIQFSVADLSLYRQLFDNNPKFPVVIYCYQKFCRGKYFNSRNNSFYHVPFLWKGRAQHAVIGLRYRCSETGLQYKRTAMQLIQAQCVHHKCVQVASSCTVVYSCVQYICTKIYMLCPCLSF